MNIVIIEQKDFTCKSNIVLRGRRAEHIKQVLHGEVGQVVKVGLLNCGIGKGRIIKMDNISVELDVNDFSISPPVSLPLTLIVAMQRPKTMKKIIQSSTAMGVKQFIIITTWKVEKSYWSSPLLKPDALKEQFLLGLEQSGDTVMPNILFRRRFKPFVEDELPLLINNALGFVAHPGSSEPCPHSINKPVVLCIGPEGGFTDYEVSKLTEAGMQAVNIGSRPLRSEFAVTALIAKLF